MASITKVVPLFSQSSGASSFVNALWWWGWGDNVRFSSSGDFTFAFFNHFLTSWTSADIITSPFSPRDWFTVFSARTFVGTRFWGVALALFSVAWFTVS